MADNLENYEVITEFKGKELAFPKRKVYKPAPKKRRLPNTKIVDVYVKQNFHITNTCKKLNISIETWYRWLKTYPDLEQQLIYAKESIKDDIEGAILKKAKAGDSQLLLHLAKTLLRDRGYGLDENKQTNTQVNIVLPEDTSKKYEWWGGNTNLPKDE